MNCDTDGDSHDLNLSSYLAYSWIASFFFNVRIDPDKILMRIARYLSKYILMVLFLEMLSYTRSLSLLDGKLQHNCFIGWLSAVEFGRAKQKHRIAIEYMYGLNQSRL